MESSRRPPLHGAEVMAVMIRATVGAKVSDCASLVEAHVVVDTGEEEVGDAEAQVAAQVTEVETARPCKGAIVAYKLGSNSFIIV